MRHPPPGFQKGRGAVSNPSGRFEPYQRQAFDDGWEHDDEPPPRVRTVVQNERTRSIIAKNDSPDVPFSRSINPYRGCEHGCIYCFARPTHAYLGYSPGLDFETHIVAKPEAPERLAEELGRPGYRCEVIALGANTDPYQPTERKLGITRRILQVLAARHHPVAIVTKSSGILRDLDILAPMAARGLASVMVSVTTIDAGLAKKMEPRAASPRRRIETLAALAEAGVPTGVLASPIIPAINDGHLEAVLEAAAGAGAKSAGYILVRLPLEIKDLFHEWLLTHFPERASHVLSLVRDTRDGALNQSQFGLRMRGSGAYAELLAQRFRLATQKLELTGRVPTLDTSQFCVPSQAGGQLELFDRRP